MAVVGGIGLLVLALGSLMGGDVEWAVKFGFIGAVLLVFAWKSTGTARR